MIDNGQNVIWREKWSALWYKSIVEKDCDARKYDDWYEHRRRQGEDKHTALEEMAQTKEEYHLCVVITSILQLTYYFVTHLSRHFHHCML